MTMQELLDEFDPLSVSSNSNQQPITDHPLNTSTRSNLISTNITKSDQAWRDAQQRSHSRQQALAQHLAQEPFRPSTTSLDFPHLPPPPSSSSPSSSSSSPLSKLEQEKLAAALNEDFDEFVSSSNSTDPNLPNLIKDLSIERRQFEEDFSKKQPIGRSGTSTPSCFDGPEGRPTPIKLLGLDEQSQAVMDDELAEGIRLHLPPRLKIPARWELLYSIDQHGTSLGTLYQRVGGASPKTNGCVVLVIRDERGDRFGAFVNEPLRPSKEYYGTGECFLWKAVNFGPDDFRIGVSVRTYAWTGVNDYMILSDQEMLSVGGGDGKFGLWIDSNLEKGISASCPAFGNEVLCSLKDDGSKNNNGKEEGSFEVLGLECWRIIV
ncbi:hypothetical protein CROQUDRAFT_662622 [Cronartium quercuum f. sp. fusiforme G11]|uniref:Oxidation resistance protein 1 n=1 Tax=Cronartium quercuum f. sp. fusiforme G11 TaxID=708437 RepID=A0A9P6NDW9_9BASI|nr:hypothetical protein CROQUDRAFT_662622 [Cronartium quercuum f. sp. fusiforme G11]